MAGDWIKMRCNLDTDPRVLELSGLLEVPVLHAVGMLWKVWAWADSHTLDGNAIRVTEVTLDRFAGVTGFAAALRKVGWLEGRDNALAFPRFAEHNGQTAKKRGETAKRVAKHRNGKCVTDVTQNVLPEKRREEKILRERESPPAEVISNQACSNRWHLPPPFDTPLLNTLFDKWQEHLWKNYQRSFSGINAQRVCEAKEAWGPEGLAQAISESLQAGWGTINERTLVQKPEPQIARQKNKLVAGLKIGEKT